MESSHLILLSLKQTNSPSPTPHLSSKSTFEYKGLKCFSFITLNVLQYSVLTATNFYSVYIFSELPLFSVVGQILKIHDLLVRALAQPLNNTDVIALSHPASNYIGMGLKVMKNMCPYRHYN